MKKVCYLLTGLLLIVIGLLVYSHIDRPAYITIGECEEKGGKAETRMVSLKYCPRGRVCNADMRVVDKKICQFRFSKTAIVE